MTSPIDIAHGSCGPRHDPYGFQELTVTLPNEFGTVQFILRSCGLRGDRLIVLGEDDGEEGLREYCLADNCFDNSARDMFETMTGLAVERWEKIYYQRFYFEDPMGSPSQYI